MQHPVLTQAFSDEHRVSFHMAQLCSKVQQATVYPITYQVEGNVLTMYADVPRSTPDAYDETLRRKHKNEDTVLENTVLLRACIDVLAHVHLMSSPNPMNIMIPYAQEVEDHLATLDQENLNNFQKVDNTTQEISSNREAIRTCINVAAPHVVTFMRSVAHGAELDLTYIKNRLSLHSTMAMFHTIVTPIPLAQKYNDALEEARQMFVVALQNVIGPPGSVHAPRTGR